MHGSLFESRCERCNVPFPDKAIHEAAGDLPECVQCGGRVRPHIVWFGEIPLQMEAIYQKLGSASLVLVVGTSGSVYPAAGFVHTARELGIRTIYVGPEQPLNADAFTEVVLGAATDVLPKLLL